MKRLLFILFLFPAVVFAPEPEYFAIPDIGGMRDERLLKAIIQVESAGNPLIINWSEQATGLLQIRPVMLREVNRIIGYDKYTVKDCLDSVKSIEMFWVVQSYHNPSGDFKRGAILWNGKSKKNLYWRKVRQII